MVGPVGGFQQVPASTITQPSTGKNEQVREREPEENKVQRQQEAPASGARKTENSGQEERMQARAAEKKEEKADEMRKEARARRGSEVDITV